MILACKANSLNIRVEIGEEFRLPAGRLLIWVHIHVLDVSLNNLNSAELMTHFTLLNQSNILQMAKLILEGPMKAFS